MSLTDKINDEIKKAMLAREKEKLEALRAVKSALLLALTSEGSGGEISEDSEIRILQKLVKQRKETAEIYLQQNRNDLATIELSQAEVIAAFLPSQMDEASLVIFIKKMISDMGAVGMKDMGRVVNAANQQLAGKAESKAIAMIVKQELQ